MKTIILNITLSTICCLFMPLLKGQCDPADTVTVSYADSATISVLTPLAADTTRINVPPPANNLLRAIIFVPGLGGNENAWRDVKEETDATTNDYQTYPARLAQTVLIGEPDNPGYTEVNGMASAGTDLHDKLRDEVNWDSIPDLTQNIIIAHSQGGLVARTADMHIHTAGVTFKSFGGVVTFGSSHQGAEILTNGLPISSGGLGMMGALAVDLCRNLTDGPVLEHLNNTDKLLYQLIRLFNLQSDILSLKNDLCESMDTLLPVVLPDLSPAITQDYMAHNQHHQTPNFLLNTLNNYNTTLPMVAFYGVEEQPVMWRQLGSMITQVYTYPAFQADPDQHHVELIDSIRVNFMSKYYIEKDAADWHKKKTDFYCGPLGARLYPLFPVFFISKCWNHSNAYKDHKAVSDAYLRGFHFIGKSNDRWQAIIGARKTSRDQNGYKCTCENLTTAEASVSIVQDPSQCEPGISHTPAGTILCERQPNWEINVNYKPSDGIVLAESARNLPGAIVNPNLTDDDYKLDKTNHQQLRNHSETALKLLDLFDTDKHGRFFNVPEL